MHSTIHAVCGQQKGQNRAKSHVWLILIIFFSQKGGASFQLFKNGRVSPKWGRAPRPTKTACRQNTVHGWLNTHAWLNMAYLSTGGTKSCVQAATGINKLSGSPRQWHITFDLKQVDIHFQKPLAGEKPSFISNVFQIFQNNWLPWKLSKMPKFGDVTTFWSNNMTKSSKMK